jgi:hypothetical protein
MRAPPQQGQVVTHINDVPLASTTLADDFSAKVRSASAAASWCVRPRGNAGAASDGTALHAA